MEMSLNINSLNIIRQRKLYKKRRKLTLVKAYYEGLLVELPNHLSNQKKSKMDLVEKYYKEDKEIINLSKDSKKTLSQKIEKQLVKFNNKRSLKRRRLKVINKKNSELENILIKFDIETNELVENINKNNSEIILKPEQLEKINVKENQIDKKYLLTLDKINKHHDKKIIKLDKKLININKKLSLKNKKIDETIELIKNNEILNDKKTLSELSLLNEKLNDKNNTEKTTQKIKSKIIILEELMKMKRDSNIHLSVNGLKMYFGGIKAVNDLSFQVKKGEIFGLIGPNGAGKTTVFNCITQFYKPTDGTIYFNNKENHIVELTSLKTHEIINEGIARSFQNVELIWELTVLDNLMVSAHSLLITNLLDHMSHSKKLRREEYILRSKGYKILEMLGISEYAFRSPYGLPYGVLKKIELARTLMTDPTMIILDEPAAGLNDQETKDLALVIKKINQDLGITIFLVEHDMGLVMSICARICAISFGKLLGIGTSKEIQNNIEVRKAYLGDDTDE